MVSRGNIMFTLLALGFAGCTPEPAPQAPVEIAEAEAQIASEIIGVATISDGDTIRIGERRIRFDGIETPRPRAMCGETNAYRAATDALRSVVRSEEVRCRIADLPADGQDIAHCRVGDVNLAAHMVANGWARAESGSAYADEEAAARAARRGVWGMNCAADPWPRAE